jgi:carbamoyltransferase
MRDKINAMVKKREAFRPFAPVVLEDKAQEHFDIDHPSPFMLETCKVTSKINLPAITHIDGSARIQTVNKKTNSRFSALLSHFYRITGCPILLNTSFNIRGQPIVCSPFDAIICFINTEIDSLVLGDFIIDKTDNSIDGLRMLLTYYHNVLQSDLEPNVYTFI